VILPDHRIRAYVETLGLGIEPYDDTLIQPGSLDVRLGPWFRTFNKRVGIIDPAEDQPDLTELVGVGPDEPFILHPGEFVLGHTIETVTLPATLCAEFSGKSSLGRLGLIVHATAGWIDAGFSGQVTTEMVNVAPLPIKLWPGMKIGQLVFTELSSAAEKPYGTGAAGSRYQGQTGPVPSRSHVNFLRGLPAEQERAA